MARALLPDDLWALIQPLLPAGAEVPCQAPGVRSRSCVIKRRDRVWPVYLPCPAETTLAR